MTRPPRTVVHVIPSLAVSDGGPTSVVVGLATAVDPRVVHTQVVTTDKGGTVVAESLGGTVLPMTGVPRWTFSWPLLRAARGLLRTADVVHVHSTSTFPSLVAMACAVLQRTPFLLQPHGAYDGYHRGQRRTAKLVYRTLLEDVLVRRAAAVVVSSSREERGVREALGPRVTVLRLPLGVDPAFLTAERGCAPGSVVFLGRLAEKKGVDVLLRAWAERSGERGDARLVVAGPVHHDLPAATRALVDHARSDPSVTFLGEVDTGGAVELLRDAALFVLPSKDESYGVAVAEALAMGVPVLTSAEVGLAEDAAASGAVAVARDRRPETYARGIDTALAARSDRGAVSDDARAWAQENLDWRTIAARYAELVDEVAR